MQFQPKHIRDKQLGEATPRHLSPEIKERGGSEDRQTSAFENFGVDGGYKPGGFSTAESPILNFFLTALAICMSDFKNLINLTRPSHRLERHH